MAYHSIIHTLLREPLLHFLLIGATLFFLYDLQNDDIVKDNNRIVITKGSINHLISLWQKKRHRPPTQSEFQAMLEQQIREQVLYREALAMGLDKDDAFIRKRLAQKIEFISSDIAAVAEPSDAELTKFLNAHEEKFAQAATLSFEHIYYSNDQRDTQAEPDALKMLAQLQQPGKKQTTVIAGDPFIMGQRYDAITEFEVARIFGQHFATELFKLQLGHWHGPITSSYGAHLIQISSKTPAKTAKLNTVRDKVRNEWQAEQRQSMNKIFYENLRKRYDIVIENVTDEKTTGQQKLARSTP